MVFSTDFAPKWCWALYAVVLTGFMVFWMGPDLLYSAGERPKVKPPPALAADPVASSSAGAPGLAAPMEGGGGAFAAEAAYESGAKPGIPVGPRFGDGAGKCTPGSANAACPGAAPVPKRPGEWSFGDYQQQWRMELGDIALKIQGEATDQQCAGFFVWGDYAWCNRAVEPGMGVHQPKSGLVGITFGIRERDPWSELMSNRYLIPTQLYDCFYGAAEGSSTRGALGHGKTGGEHQAKANGVARCKVKGKGDGELADGCYDAPYTINRVCVSNTSTFSKTGQEWPHTTLAAVLQGREPLSVHMKIDAEGSEWNELEALLNSLADMDKIRTLDMEIHYNLGDWNSATRCQDQSSEPHLRWKISIMERLAKYFAVSGTTLQCVLEKQLKIGSREPAAWAKTELDKGGRHCVISSTGWHLDMYCLSFVNRKLLAS